MIDWIISAILSIEAALAGIRAQAKDTLDAFAGWVRDTLGLLYALVADAFEWLIAKLKDVIDLFYWNMMQVLIDLTRSILAIRNWFAETILQWWYSENNVVRQWVESLFVKLGAFWDILMEHLEGLWNLILSKLEEWWHSGTNFIKQWVEGLLALLPDAWDAIIDRLGDWWRDRQIEIKALINQGWATWANLLNNLDKIKDEIWAFFSNPTGWLWEKIDLWLFGNLATKDIESLGLTGEAAKPVYDQIPAINDAINTEAEKIKDPELAPDEPTEQFIEQEAQEMEAVMREERGG